MVILSKTKKIGFFYINWAISDKKPGQKECTSRFEFKLCGVFLTNHSYQHITQN